MKPMNSHRIVGERVQKIDGMPLVTGEAKFTADLVLPGMLYCKILRSTVPSARIVSIDTSKAKQLPGVRAVVTSEDTLKRPCDSPMPGLIETPEYPLALDRVRFIGEEVAAVAAIDESSAEKALSLIKVDYEELPYVLDPEEALSHSAPLLHEQLGTNIVHKIDFTYGDVDSGFALADHIRSDRFVIESVNHCALEPHAALASYESSGKLTVWSSTQSPMHQRDFLSATLGLPQNDIRIIKPYVGGAFGGKNGYTTPEFCASLLSMKTGRPVKIVLTREEVFCATRGRHPMVIRLKTGITSEGTITAREAQVIMNAGAYGSIARMTLGRLFNVLTLLYRTPAITCKGFLVHTNNPTFGPQRGLHGQQIRHADELQIDLLARDLDLDPLEVRLANAVEADQVTPHGNRITSCGLRECLEKVAEASGYRMKKGRLPKGRGVAIAVGSYISGGGPPIHSSAVVRLDADGSVVLFTGACDLGQGSNTMLGQIVAQELGVTIDRIRVISADTELAPADAGTFASRTTIHNGNAALNAARDAKRQLLLHLAGQSGSAPEELDTANNQIVSKDGGGIFFSLDEAVRRCPPVFGIGHYREAWEPMDYRTGTGNWAPAYTFGAVAVEVEVDEKSGQLTIDQITAAHDCGYAINPMTVEGQMEGATVQGLGQALSELVVRDKRGATLNPSFLTYKLPLITEAVSIDSLIVETTDPEGPFGAKGVAEGMLLPVPPAAVNAALDAANAISRSSPLQRHKLYSKISRHSGKPSKSKPMVHPAYVTPDGFSLP